MQATLLNTPYTLLANSEPTTITATLYFWEKKCSKDDYKILTEEEFMLKQGHVAIELPAEVSRKLIGANIAEIRPKPFYLSFFPRNFRTKIDDFRKYNSNKFSLEIRKITLDLEGVCAFIVGKLNINFFPDSDEEETNYLDNKGIITDLEWRKCVASQFHVFYPAGSSHLNYATYMGATNYPFAQSTHLHNCTTFVVEVIEAGGRKLPLGWVPCSALTGFQLMTSAMASFNIVSAYKLLSSWIYTQRADNAWGRPLHTAFVRLLGIISIGLTVTQAAIFVLQFCLLPLLRNNRYLERLDESCSCCLANPQLNMAIGFFFGQLVITLLNIAFEEHYFGSLLGLVAGATTIPILVGLSHWCVNGMSNAIMDDTNWILKPGGLHRMVRCYFWRTEPNERATAQLPASAVDDEENQMALSV